MAIRKSFTFDDGDRSARATLLDGVISKRSFQCFLKKAGLRKQKLVRPSTFPDGIVYADERESVWYEFLVQEIVKGIIERGVPTTEEWVERVMAEAELEAGYRARPNLFKSPSIK